MAEKARRERGTGSIYRQPGCTTWTIKYHRNGRAVRESTGLTNYQAARQKLNQRLNEVARGTFVGLKLERIMVEELADDFLRDQRINARKSASHAESRWENHLKGFFGNLRVAEVTSSTIAKYVDERMSQGAENATINRELAALKRMFRLGYFATPAKVFRLPAFPRLEENNTRSGFLEDEQYQRLAEAASELWLRAFVEASFTYGWRKRELLDLRVRQVDLAARTIRLDPGSTKNRDGREATMTANLHALIGECVRDKKPDDYVFTRANGRPVKDLRDAWQKLCIAAGVGRMICRQCGEPVAGEKCDRCKLSDLKYSGLIVHDTRRTAARNLRRAGVAEGVIMRIGGWRTRSVFERYNIVTQADIADAVGKLERQREQQAEQQKERDSKFGHDFGHDSRHGGQEEAQTKTEMVN